MGVSAKRRFEVFDRDRFTCRYCGRSAPHVRLECEHVLARVHGGTDLPDNLVTSCFDCNRGKSARRLTISPPESAFEELKYGFEWLIQNHGFEEYDEGYSESDEDDEDSNGYFRLLRKEIATTPMDALVVSEKAIELYDPKNPRQFLGYEFDPSNPDFHWTIRETRGYGIANHVFHAPRNKLEANALIYCVCGMN
jgi:hypothetical protein